MHPLEHLYLNRKRELYSYALCLTGHRQDAEDAIHSTFQKLLASKSHLNKRDLAPYVFRCLRNHIIDQHRQRGLAQFREMTDASLDHEHLTASPTPSHRLALEELDLLWKSVGPLEQEIIALKAMDGFTFREIALIQDASINTVSSCYRRGLVKMKQALHSLLQREIIL